MKTPIDLINEIETNNILMGKLEEQRINLKRIDKDMIKAENIKL